jgi:hypothetical protein
MYNPHNQGIAGESLMQKNYKKKYEKPKLTKITLDPETAVLGKCKNLGLTGPNGFNCRAVAVCREPGS